jgi:hypothetical protein
VIGREGADPFASLTSANWGNHFEAGTSSESFPSSTRVMIAVTLIDFVIEAIQKRWVSVIAIDFSRSAMPVAPWWITLPS